MTDKQMIIDDVDVSKCNYFNNTDKSYCEECCSEFGCAICNDRPNCYYKQLARKEEECEELKEDRERWKSNFNGKVSAIEELLKQFDQLKAENEELKKQVCGLLPELKYIIDETCSKHNIQAKTYHEKIIEIINNLDKYEQTLIKIKEIVHKSVIGGARQQILQKISEVEDEHNG